MDAGAVAEDTKKIKSNKLRGTRGSLGKFFKYVIPRAPCVPSGFYSFPLSSL